MRMDTPPLITKQKFVSYAWANSNLLFSTNKNNIRIYTELNTAKKINIENHIFDVNSEILSTYNKVKHSICISNWKNETTLHSLTPSDKVTDIKLNFQKNELVTRENQADGERYVLYDLDTDAFTTICDKYNFYRNLNISHNSEYLTMIAWNKEDIASYKTKLLLFERSGSNYSKKDIETPFEHVFDAKISHDEKFIYALVRGSEKKYHDLWRYDLTNKKWDVVFLSNKDLTRPLENNTGSCFCISKHYAFFLSTENSFSKIKAIDLNTKKIKEFHRLKKYTFIEDLKIDESGNLLSFIGSSYSLTPRLIKYDISKNTTTKVIDSTDQTYSHMSLSKPEFMSWKTSGNTTSKGLFYPTPLRDRAPLVIMIHNPTFGQCFARWPSKAHFLNSLGYHALYVNYRGSSGYGKKYLESNNSSFGKKEAKDIFFAVEHLRTSGRIQNSKVGLWGGGAGATIALRAMQMFPYLFRIGIVVYPYIEIESIIKRSAPIKREFLRFWAGDNKRLPLNKIFNPVLMFQGRQDKLVLESETSQFFNELNHSKSSELIVWDDEEHSLTQDHNKRQYYAKISERLQHVFAGGEQFTDFSSEVNISSSAIGRFAYRSLAIVALILGITGMFLPIMPTVPFVLIAAILYSYSSETSYNKLMNNKFFGPPLRSWLETKCLSTKLKVGTICGVIVSFGGSSLFFVSNNYLRASLLGIALMVIISITKMKNMKELYLD